MVSADPAGELGYVELASGGRQHEAFGVVDRVGQVTPIEDAEDSGRGPCQTLVAVYQRVVAYQ